MLSRAKAIALSLVGEVVGRALDRGQAHPGLVLAIGLAVTGALYGLGIWTDLDWWGNREIPR